MDVRLRRGAVLVSGVLLAAGSLAGTQVGATARVDRGAGAGAGVTSRVSVAHDGAQANKKSVWPAISADGRYVAFESRATNLATGDTNRTFDVFVRDRRNGTTRLVSASSSGVPGNLFSGAPSISSDGRFVAFTSDSSNLVPGDTNDNADVFVRDLQTETTERVSIGDDEAQLDRVSAAPEISGNGRFVMFQTHSNPPDPNAPPTALVRDRTAGTTQAIPSFSGTDAAISEHGRFVAFSTNSRLGPNDTDDDFDVYVLDRRTGTRRLASTKGFHGGDVSISGNGRFVAYDASRGPRRNIDRQVFVRDMRGKTVRIVSVNRRGVPGNNDSAHPVLSRDGHYVAFWSGSTNLAPRTSSTATAFQRASRGPSR